MELQLTKQFKSDCKQTQSAMEERHLALSANSQIIDDDITIIWEIIDENQE